MKIFLTSLVFSLSCLFVHAQQDRFIYLQTENKQPFFVKINDKVLNSYPLGYLIIPKLDDGMYSLIIGFTGTTAEQQFNCSINKKDAGFIIKDAGENHWQLVNVQSKNIIAPGDVITKPVIAYEKETDPFSTMLASAVNDSTILRKDVAKEIVAEKPVEQKDTTNTIIRTDVALSNNALIDSANKDVAKETLPVKSEQKDSIQTTVNTDVVTAKADNAISDSTKKDIAKETFPEKSNELNSKDSTQTASKNEVVILKPDSVNDVAKETTPEKTNEVVPKDTSLTVAANEVAVTKPTKKKKSKKNDNALQDSTVVQKDIVKETIPEKTLETIPKDTSQIITTGNEVAVTKSRKRKLKKTDNALQDSTVVQKDIVKETIPEKAIETIPKDISRVTTGDEIAATKSVKKKKVKSKKSDTALQDSAIAQNDVAKEVVPERANDNKETVQNSTADVAVVKSTIKRKSKKSNRDGIVMTYIDDSGETKDTITVLIPSNKKVKAEVTEPVVSATVQNDKPKDNVNNKNKADYTVTKQEKEIIKEANKEPVFISTMINSDCKNVATEDDFLKIRKKMVAEDNDKNMIKAARKYFKTKCFTTEQIKNLSVLFLNDEGKYLFFDAAYPFVSDSDLYASLEKQLSDVNYITRFRALIHK